MSAFEYLRQRCAPLSRKITRRQEIPLPQCNALSGRMVVPSCWMRLTPPEFSADDGSSHRGFVQKEDAGLWHRAPRQHDTPFFSPESVFVSTSTLCAISTVSSKLVIPSFLSDAFMPKSRPWMSRFSRTESSASRLRCWLTTPHNALASNGCSVRLRPASLTVPPSAGPDRTGYVRSLSFRLRSVRDRPQVPDPLPCRLMPDRCGFGQMISWICFSLNHQSGACRWVYWEEMRA